VGCRLSGESLLGLGLNCTVAFSPSSAADQ
jgi:hypothetical protein